MRRLILLTLIIQSCGLQKKGIEQQYKIIPKLIRTQHNYQLGSGRIVVLQLDRCGVLCGNKLNSFMRSRYVEGISPDSTIFLATAKDTLILNPLLQVPKSRIILSSRELLLKYGIFSSAHGELRIRNGKVKKISLLP